MEALSIFTGGSNRIILPYLALPPLVAAPSILLALLVIIPNDKLHSVIKQILSIPLLAAVFLIPFGFTNGDRGIKKGYILCKFYLFYYFISRGSGCGRSQL
jgi:hypothetical protein